MAGCSSCRSLSHFSSSRTSITGRPRSDRLPVHGDDPEKPRTAGSAFGRDDPASGITIKVIRRYELHGEGWHTYKLNLMDTPGHVDFVYEVSRSLAACEGALLDRGCAQGVRRRRCEWHLANKQGLTLIPWINKIDLPNADIHGEVAARRYSDDPGMRRCWRAKAGLGIEETSEGSSSASRRPGRDPRAACAGL